MRRHGGPTPNRFKRISPSNVSGLGDEKSSQGSYYQATGERNKET